MLLILEGPDGSGKTSLANKLSKQTGYNILHFSKPETEEEKDRMYEMYEELIVCNRYAILDRSWYSEMVYGAVMRDSSYISFDEMYQLEQILADIGALIIYCTGPREVLWRRCTKRGEDYITSMNKFNQIYDKYEELMSLDHIVPVVKYAFKDL